MVQFSGFETKAAGARPILPDDFDRLKTLLGSRHGWEVLDSCSLNPRRFAYSLQLASLVGRLSALAETTCGFITKIDPQRAAL